MGSKCGWILAVLLMCMQGVSAASAPEWENFGDWQVAKISDSMDPVPQVLIRTKFDKISRSPKSEEFVIGFQLTGKRSMRLHTMVNLGVDAYWPECGFNSSSYSVDGSKAKYIATIDNPGGCDLVSRTGDVIKKFSTGRTARLRIDGVDGDISLAGFPAAWARAIKLSQ